MKSRITKTVALAALMAGAAGVANATEGWYGRADLGWSFDGEFDVADSPGDHPWGATTLEHDWTEHLGLGYAFQNGFRLEGEIGHRFNEMDPKPDMDAGGDAHAWSAMLNLFYDFNKGGGLEPYIGVGVGGARIGVSGFDHAPNPSVGFNDDDTVFAYQGIVGVALSVTEQLDVDVGYRYFRADGVEFSAAEGANLTPVTREGDYIHEALTVGLRYQFAGAAPPPPPPPPPPVAPPPPPPPVAAACPTSEFVVYFEWDRSNLNQAALETIDAAVNRARECNVSGVVVVGHTDTSGSPAYNQGLSERRASVVRDALVARGMATEQITAEAHGETDLARPTADGVREPLNRRTAVTISFR